MGSFFKKRCPGCGKEIPLRLSLHYIIWGTNHTVRCPHCNSLLCLKKEPVPFVVCYMIGFISMTLPMIVGLFFLKLGFLNSLLKTLPIVGIILILICLHTLKNIEYRVD